MFASGPCRGHATTESPPAPAGHFQGKAQRLPLFLVLHLKGYTTRLTARAPVGRRVLSAGSRFSLGRSAAARLPRPGAARRAFARARGNAAQATREIGRAHVELQSLMRLS